MKIVETTSSDHHDCSKWRIARSIRDGKLTACWCIDQVMLACDQPFLKDPAQTCDVIVFDSPDCEGTTVECDYCHQSSVVTAL